MKAIWIKKHGGREVLEVRESEDPKPNSAQVRIRVKAAGLNFAEVMARQGSYPAAPKAPMVVGYEVSGEIDELGDGVDDFEIGDRVIALTKFGGHADCVCVPVKQVFKMPQNMSFEEGAALPVNYFTAYHMLFQLARVRPKDRVLIHMAAGGVGTAVCQMGRAIDGLEIFGTASAPKHDYLRAQGCTHPIDYRNLDYAEEILKLTNNEGVDFVFDPLGGRDWKKGYKLIRPGGQLVAFGFSRMLKGSKKSLAHMLREGSGIPMKTPLGLMADNRAIAGVDLGQLWSYTDLLAAHMKGIMAFFEAGVVKPQVDKSFKFEDAAEAHGYIEDGLNRGKVVLLP